MRKYQQNQILKLLRTIEEAQSEGFYADCQAGAVSIGNFIESIEGEGTKTVTLLEEYCELLFKANKGEIKEKLLRKHLIKIENSITLDLKPNRIEMVFLLYKASMADSLESIYLAAKADPNCDAYWIPIPYYELNADGSLGTMHYEGADRYADNIVCTDWQEYDIEARHPDVIFTHYAYDDNVNNATIHPAFYSKRLQGHCELLVYVPYFVAARGIVEEYCGCLPGVLYAHHVIVESESVRQSYIGHYKKFDKEFGWNGQFGKAEKKFIAYGSPKFDKVINTMREDCELPPEWKSLICNPDGSRKKVVLYNTHMFTWINNGDDYFKKLQFVFDSFRSHDDVVLWWRPHPNTELNFETKRPQWLGAYKQIVDNYRLGGWGIYDDTPDLHRAIALSDAYFGDMSSLVTLYKVTGKPILTQSINLSLSFEAFIQVGDYYWFTALDFNGLFKLKINSDKAEYVGSFRNVNYSSYRMFSDITHYKNKLIFTPFSANEIHFYDMDTGEFSYIPIVEYKKPPYKTVVYREDSKFSRCIVSGDTAFIFPYSYPAIIKYDLINMELNYLYEPFKDISKSIKYPNTFYFWKYMVNSDSIYLWCSATNSLFEFSCDCCEIEERFVAEGNDKYINCNAVDDYFWLTPFGTNTKIIRLSKDFKSKQYYDLPKEFITGSSPLGHTAVVDESIYMFPGTGNAVVNVDTTNGDIQIAHEFDIDATVLSKYPNHSEIFKFNFANVFETNLAAFDVLSSQLIIYDVNSRQLTKTPIYMQTETPNNNGSIKGCMREKLGAAQILSDTIIKESPLQSLDLFLELLSEKNDYPKSEAHEIVKNSIPHSDGTAGRAIYDYIKGEVLK